MGQCWRLYHIYFSELDVGVELWAEKDEHGRYCRPDFSITKPVYVRREAAERLGQVLLQAVQVYDKYSQETGEAA